MSLYQNSVLIKYLKEQDSTAVNIAYEKFKIYFFDREIQENIRNINEEQYQESFLTELFVNIFGYTINPNPNYNLTTEFKNETGGKKADGAILQQGKALGVIELKSTKTKELESVRQQAFDYKANQSNCVYVITSNFEKLRFYINNAVEFEEFDLFNISANRFELLYLCLAKDNLLNGIPLKIKDASIIEEEAITKEFYADYSLFKRELFRDLVQQNLENKEFESLAEKNVKKILYKKTQKLLDRFLFILFAEDRGLLPPNSISKILDQWKQLKDLDAYSPLYERYIKYFGYLNTGWKGKEFEIFAYNGGLFKSDDILDTVKIDDDLLFKHTTKLTQYDFETDVDVNILGHIFEHSITEIESVNAEIEGVEFDKQKTKRKKEGVYYTPRYITKYIVDNTVGRLCEKQKIMLEIVKEEYQKGRKGRRNKTILDLDNRLNQYRNWLLSLIILDPACGSGAFLNQALVFLINEHRYIDKLRANLFGISIVFQDIETQVLENNIYGVDLNEESVEIAKLSLWLRTAKKGRKLTTLSNNIKCGNSLIDDPVVAGDKAFNWQQEFPDVFSKGGFDVVIGNPPYLNMTVNNTNKKWLEHYVNAYKSVRSANSKNIYTLFIELGTLLVKSLGRMSYIVPEGLFKTRSYKDCVNVLHKTGTISEIVYFEDWVFEDAVTGSLIFNYTNKPSDKEPAELVCNHSKEFEPYKREKNTVTEKIDSSKFPILKDVSVIFKGMVVKDRKSVLFEEKNENEDIFLLGNCISRYQIKNQFYCNYDDLIIVGGTKKIEKYRIKPRILIRRTGDSLCCSFLEKDALTESTLYSCYPINNEINIYFLLGLLNSKLYTYYIRQKMITNKQAFPQILMTDLQNLKVPIAPSGVQFKLKNLVNNVSTNIGNHNNISVKFLRFISSKYGLEKQSIKLQNWHQLEFAEFIKELNKAIKKTGGVKLSKKDEIEWMELFDYYKQLAQQLQLEIDKTEKEVDQMVYELYDLTEEEIGIVEGK